MNTKSGKAVHPIGIGTWLVGGTATFDPTDRYNGAKPDPAHASAGIDAIRYSLTKGQNHIDCAELYGGFYTDEVVGRALAGTTREDIFIADKLWKTSVGVGQVRPTVERMLQKLGTDYLDLLYIHAPWFDAPWREAIPQIDELINEGVVRGLGVSNFTVAQMKEVEILATHPIAAVQKNYNVLHTREVDEDFREFCHTHTIQIVAYQPVKRREVLASDAVQRVALRYHATPAQVALAWLLAKGALPIPKALQTAHIDENLGALQLRLSVSDIETLDNIATE